MKPDCRVHEGNAELWIVCVHTAAITSARLVKDSTGQVVGEALCSSCEKDPRQAHNHLRLACGGCVRDRYPIVGAN